MGGFRVSERPFLLVLVLFGFALNLIGLAFLLKVGVQWNHNGTSQDPWSLDEYESLQ